eukprot:gb/GEZN01004998.1/.p1 GENE.gb/GEZN01004998.1/~~gb/GEZN01004998.1/.p1  ORF type:complete len:111 (+),score=6.34 gb/GEZN01004998.1/:367-699(+)
MTMHRVPNILTYVQASFASFLNASSFIHQYLFGPCLCILCSSCSALLSLAEFTLIFCSVLLSRSVLLSLIREKQNLLSLAVSLSLAQPYSGLLIFCQFCSVLFILAQSCS